VRAPEGWVGIPGGGNTVRQRSTPGLNIPDNHVSGVRDTMQIVDAGTVAGLRVKVEITHTFVGDLRVTLHSPSGKSVALHSGTRGNAKNLIATYDSVDVSALAALAGDPLAGAWSLVVQDLAAVDVGVLQAWGLELRAVADSTITQTDSPGATIPDFQPAGIERTLTVSDAGRIAALAVSVDINHTFIGDLTVALVSPVGTSVPLHTRTGGSTQNLAATWSSTTVAALAALAGEPCQGVWRLRVADHDRADVGN
jgi:subtilisin-like proprotein convertase family protein